MANKAIAAIIIVSAIALTTGGTIGVQIARWTHNWNELRNEQIVNRLDRMNERIGRRVGRLEERAEERLSGIRNRIDALEQRTETLSEKMGEIRRLLVQAEERIEREAEQR